ncbi:MAG: hypothetical protein Tsb002_32880 [Wenzhouxiangellaceae bacterium]
MNDWRRFLPNWRGLVVKLAVFYLVLAIPTLLLVEATILLVEFRHLQREIEQGALFDAIEDGVSEIRLGRSPRTFTSDPWVAWLDSWLIRLELPGEIFSDEAGYVLSELSREPLAAAFYAGDGELIAQVPPYRQQELLLPDAEQLQAAYAAAGPIELAAPDSDALLRRTLSTVTDENFQFVGWLYLELRIPPPWRKILGDISFEWPIVLSFLIIFAGASSIFLTAYVTARLRRVTQAAAAWSQGDFSQPIGDRSPDELGRLSQSLDQMAEQFRDLMRTRTRLASLEERQRLARDLHDTVKQKAFVLNLQLAAAGQRDPDPQRKQELAAAQQLCHQIQQELATLLEELRTDQTHSGEELIRRLRQQFDEWQQFSGIEVRFQSDELPPVDANTEEQLLRITTEALSNILRHSGASRVWAYLQHSNQRLMLSISDNGSGALPKSGRRDGMGLRNMRQRASLLANGECRIEGWPGSGTRIEIECDLEADSL